MEEIDYERQILLAECLPLEPGELRELLMLSYQATLAKAVQEGRKSIFQAELDLEQYDQMLVI